MSYVLPTKLFDSCSGGVAYCLAKWANDATAGLFWPAMLVAFVVIIFLSTQRFGTPRSYGFAAVIGLLGAVMLATMQLLAWWIATIFILNGALGVAVLILNER